MYFVYTPSLVIGRRTKSPSRVTYRVTQYYCYNKHVIVVVHSNYLSRARIICFSVGNIIRFGGVMSKAAVLLLYVVGATLQLHAGNPAALRSN